MQTYRRPQADALSQRLREPVRWINIVAGPRQVGKTTLVRQVLEEFPNSRYLSADAASEVLSVLPFAIGSSPSADSVGGGVAGSPDAAWLVRQWQQARLLAKSGQSTFVLAIDEIQKIPRWSETVKGLWDEDRADGLAMHVVLLGSSPLLVQDGLAESLAGRFEPTRTGHWSYPEMHAAFGFGIEEFVYFGGYPGPIAAGLHRDEARWRSHVIGALIEPSIDRDILALNRVDRPALLKQLFWLGCDYSAQVLALAGMAENLREMGSEDVKGHTNTVAKYLDLLSKAGLLASLQKYSGSKLRQRTSSPKLLALNNALMAVATGYGFAAARADRTLWGRMVECVAGAHLVSTADPDTVTYWREGKREVDFVLGRGQRLAAIEVKSGAAAGRMPGLDAFVAGHTGTRRVVVGDGGDASLVEFLSYPAEYWL